MVSARNSRRTALLGGVALLLGGCAITRDAAPDAPAPPGAPQRWRRIDGGFVAPPGGPFGVPARPLAGPYVRLVAPTALALSGNDLLVVDSGAARVWRIDLALQTLAPIAGAPATPATTVALGADLSAWVLDSVARSVQRYARDGRRLQTLPLAPSALSTAAFALVDGGATLLVVDDTLRRWFELRPAGVLPVPVQPGPDDAGLRSLDGIAVQGERIALLDRSGGVVHLARRDGLLLGQVGAGVLKQPAALALDRWGRVYVHDAHDGALKRFDPAAPLPAGAEPAAEVFPAAQLGVQQIGALALDERILAVADRLLGEVALLRIDPPAR